MPYVFITSYLPNERSAEAAKIYLEFFKEDRSKYKPLSKEIIPNAVKARKDCIEVTGVHDIKEGKLEEFLVLQQNLMVRYHKIEGFRYEIEVRFKVTEALEMLGFKPPEMD
ncbi:MAG: hypothetical protein P8Y97_09155 [Candidatus Lokiarchaeota archaeon]